MSLSMAPTACCTEMSFPIPRCVGDTAGFHGKLRPVISASRLGDYSGADNGRCRSITTS